MKNQTITSFKIEMLSNIASSGSDELKWCERANTPRFTSIMEAKAFMSKHCPNAPFVPYGDSDKIAKVKKVYSRGTPYRVVF